MRCFLLIMLIAVSSCAERKTPVLPQLPPTVISVGQTWTEATKVAVEAGYELNDASQLAMVPTPNGFYIDMPSNRGLIVNRDVQEDKVQSLDMVENWPGPKVYRIHHHLESFNVPKAELISHEQNTSVDTHAFE